MDCNMVLSKVKKDRYAHMETKDIDECPHDNKDYRGTSATTWQWRCKDCGKKESGFKQPGTSGRVGSTAQSSSPSDVAPPGRPPYGPAPQRSSAETVVDMMRNALSIQRDVGQDVPSNHLDIIFRRCRELVFGVDSQSPVTEASRSSLNDCTSQCLTLQI